MKLKILNTKNAENGSVDFPVSEEIREDLIKRAVLALQSRTRQPYGADPRAGLKHSTRISRRRRKFRGSYGLGISRSPRKILSKKGRRIHWVGAEAPNTVGGRRAHPPKADKKWEKHINRKENRKAINSAMCAALDASVVAARGHKIPKSYPFALDTDFDDVKKTAEVRSILESLGFADELVRGDNGGKTLLLVTESKQFAKAAKNIAGIDVATASELNAELLAPGAHPGRVTLFTVNSIKAMSGKTEKAPAKKAAKKEVKA